MHSLNVGKLELIKCFSAAFDLVHPALFGHHQQVAYISAQIAAQIGLGPPQQLEIVLAALVHDVGALQHNSDERIKLLTFEADDVGHAEAGYQLLNIFEPFHEMAEIVRYHHLSWNNGEGQEKNGKEVPLASHIIHLADRVAVMIKKGRNILSESHSPVISKKVKNVSGKIFHPDLVESFMALADKEYFWLDIVSSSPVSSIEDTISPENIDLSESELLHLAKVFSQLIDFRSRFTATHSAGVAASGALLAKLEGFSDEECFHMRLAAYFHDLGKLAIPHEILEKPSALTRDEFGIIKCHAYYTYQILKHIPAFKKIKEWGAHHHERLDGTGYPFHWKNEEIDLGSKIMAVADVFTAVAEDRPYRKGMTEKQVLEVLQNMKQSKALHAGMVELLEENFEEVNEIRRKEQEVARREYNRFYKRVYQ